MSSRQIRFYFDYISPNAYIAWSQLPALAEKYGYTVEPMPVLYAALLDASGTLGPGETPAKGRWMQRNFMRKAKLLGLSLKPPPFFPFSPLIPLRLSLLPLDRDKHFRLLTALFEAVWGRGLHMSEPAVVERFLYEIGYSGTEMLKQAQAPEIKDRLRRQTDEAISNGVFGVPTMRVDGELFWGYDDFPYMEMFLAGKDPLDRELAEAWERPVKASSVRRRVRDSSRR